MKWTTIATLVALCFSLSCEMLGEPGEGDGGAPGGFSASSGEGNSIKLSWSTPTNSQGKKAAVSSYSVYRDGSYIASTSSTSYLDTSATMATVYTYHVTATFKSGSVSSASSSSTGFYITSTKMMMGIYQGQQNAVTSTNWYNTYVNKGWTYHFSSSSTAQLFDYHRPGTSVSGSSNNLSWTADRTGKVWIYCTAGLTAWYD